MTRLLGVQIAHGLTSETRVFASLLAHRNDRYDAVLLVHEPAAAGDDTRIRLGMMANAKTVAIDTGWRPNPRRTRYSVGRARVASSYLLRVRTSVDRARSLQPDLIYSSQQHYDCRTASRIARALVVPQIIHLHYNVGPSLRRVVVDRLRTTDHVVAVSDFVRRQVLRHGVGEQRVTTIRNTIHPYPAPSPELVAATRTAHRLGDRFIFGMVGRLDQSKGHLDAIEAMELCGRDDVALVIVGRGRIESRVRRRAAESPLASRIVFTGQRSDIPELLAGFDALLHPASADPCPLAVLEAMAAGRAVLAYDDGGLPELVTNNATGLLVPHGDTRSLATAMADLRDDPTCARRMGAAGRRQVAERFRPEDGGAAFADLVTSMT